MPRRCICETQRSFQRRLDDLGSHLTAIMKVRAEGGSHGAKRSERSGGARAKRRLTVALGLFLLLTVDWCSDFAIPVGSRDFASQASGGLLSSLVPAALKVVVLVAVALRPERFERWFERRGIPATCGLIATLTFVASRFTAADILPEALLVALSEASSSLLFLFWLSRCCRLSPRKTQLALPLAFLLMAMGILRSARH